MQRPPSRTPLWVGLALIIGLAIGVGAVLLLRRDGGSVTSPTATLSSIWETSTSAGAPPRVIPGGTIAIITSPPTTAPPGAVVTSSTIGTPIGTPPSSVATPSSEGSSSAEPTPVGPQPTPPPVTVPPPVGAVTPAGATASATRSPSNDSCGQRTDYGAANLLDHTRATAWMVSGDGAGVTITLDLGATTALNFVGLVPGYDKIDVCGGNDRFGEMRRISQVRWEFSSGVSLTQHLDVNDRSMQFVEIPGGTTADRVTLTIVTTVAPGVARLDHTPISDIELGLH